MLDVFAQSYVLLILTLGDCPGLLTPEQNLLVMGPILYTMIKKKTFLYRAEEFCITYLVLAL